MSVLLVAALLAYTPAEAQALFVEANDASQRQEYAVAVEKYQRLLSAGHSGPDVLFNLGTTHLAANQLGPAVLYLLRAQRLSNAEDIEAQLAVAQQRLIDQVVGGQEAAPFAERIARALNERLVTIAFVVVWWLALALLVMLARSTGRRLTLGLLTGGAWVLALLLGSAVATHAWVSLKVSEAVVMVPTSKVREAPSDAGRVAFEVHAGLLVRVMEDTGRFVRIRLPNALEGWVDKSEVTAL